jgi:hypothetical protein
MYSSTSRFDYLIWMSYLHDYFIELFPTWFMLIFIMVPFYCFVGWETWNNQAVFELLFNLVSRYNSSVYQMSSSLPQDLNTLPEACIAEIFRHLENCKDQQSGASVYWRWADILVSQRPDFWGPLNVRQAVPHCLHLSDVDEPSLWQLLLAYTQGMWWLILIFGMGHVRWFLMVLQSSLIVLFVFYPVHAITWVGLSCQLSISHEQSCMDHCFKLPCIRKSCDITVFNQWRWFFTGCKAMQKLKAPKGACPSRGVTNSPWCRMPIDLLLLL